VKHVFSADYAESIEQKNGLLPIKIPQIDARPISFSQPLTLQVIGTGKGGIWREKPSDAESASWGRFLASAANGPHLSGAPHQDRERAIIFPERTWSCPEDAVLGAFYN